jgi:4a-hydroxytetrahydrobiopterin dehydratase
MQEQLAALGARWSIVGPDLQLKLTGATMTKYGAVAAHAAVIADEMNHHPTITLEYGGLTLHIHTHDKKAITQLDWDYARRLEDWLREAGW